MALIYRSVMEVEGRAHQLQRHLAGVAPVYLLGQGAVQSFSKAFTDNGYKHMDVHSGAVRTYLPDIDRGTQARHRFVHLDRFKGNRDPIRAAARFVEARVPRRSCCESSP